MLRRLLPDPFLLVLLATVALASLLPARGGAIPWVNRLAVATVVLLFFLHGARLSRAQVWAGIGHWRLHLAILAATFVGFPLAGLLAERALPGLLPPLLWTGLLFVCALPSTVQSAIAFVGLARGNVPAAIASASLSQMLGVLLTPLLMAAMAGAHGGGVNVAGIEQVGAQILLPFAVGQGLSPWIGAAVRARPRLTGVTDRATILVSVYVAFSAAVLEGIWHRLPAADLARLALVDLVLLAVALAATGLAGRLAGFDRADRVALQFCGTKKSLVQGVPMARVLFPPASAGIVLLPMMLFHQLQLMACAWLARRYAERGAEPA